MGPRSSDLNTRQKNFPAWLRIHSSYYEHDPSHVSPKTYLNFSSKTDLSLWPFFYMELSWTKRKKMSTNPGIVEEREEVEWKLPGPHSNSSQKGRIRNKQEERIREGSSWLCYYDNLVTCRISFSGVWDASSDSPLINRIWGKVMRWDFWD